MAGAGTILPSRTPGAAVDRRGERLLRYAALVFAAGFLLHNADHFRRGIDAVTSQVLWAGTVSGIVTLTAIALVLAGHREAPFIALAVGFSMAIGVSTVHLLPQWSTLSDALPGGDVDALSWIAVLAEVGGALAFGVAGAYVLRQRSLARSGA